MKIALAAYEFQNRDLAFNLTQIEKGLQATAGRAELLCFGEAFLQGFDALCWDWEKDKELAVACNSDVFKTLCEWTVRYGVDLLFGYIERDGESVYSSCAVIESGVLVHNYRRRTKGWKEYWRTDGHYREGETSVEFSYRGRNLMIALCGDLWEEPELFRTGGVLIWPVYVSFELEEWKTQTTAYARQAQIAADTVLMINSLSKDPPCHGGAFLFHRGKTADALPFDREEILIAEV